MRLKNKTKYKQILIVYKIMNLINENNILSGNSDNDKINPLRDSVSNSLANTKNISSIIEEKNEETNNININIYIYKFTNEFTDELFKFSKIHQYDHRTDFKEAWNEWLENNSEIVDEETRRLINLGYDGDILDKMFKSARYYFRKKSTEKKEPSKRRIYIGGEKELLELMDNHINTNIHIENFKPSEGFNEFCKNNTEILKQSVFTLYRAGITNSDEIKNKIKKTYKNRYFLIISK